VSKISEATSNSSTDEVIPLKSIIKVILFNFKRKFKHKNMAHKTKGDYLP
jgi:hypothetical protein